MVTLFSSHRAMPRGKSVVPSGAVFLSPLRPEPFQHSANDKELTGRDPGGPPEGPFRGTRQTAGRILRPSF
jgi:hypothetical protein